MAKHHNSFGSWFFTLLIVCLGGYYRGNVSSDSEVNKPAGAIEYFETTDGKQKFILYSDKIVAKGFGSMMNPNDRRDYDIPLYTVQNVTKAGQNLRINMSDGSQLTLQFNTIMVGSARELKESIDRLLRQGRSH